jgi:hypothetical protein
MYEPMTKMVNFWNDPGVMLITTDWITVRMPSCTCHQRCSLDLEK